LLTEAEAGDVLALLRNDRNRAKLRMMFSESYVIVMVLRLIDVVVGCEMDDFKTKGKREVVNRLREILQDETARLKIIGTTSDPAHVLEHWAKMKSKWGMLSNRYEDDDEDDNNADL